MSVRVKLLVIVTFVALVPLGFLAYTTLGLHQQALHRTISEVHVRSAKYGATLVEGALERSVMSLQRTIETSIDWEQLSPREQEGALWLLQGQLGSIAQIALLDANGTVLAATTSAEQATGGSSLLQPMAAAIELAQVVAGGFARGHPVRVSGPKPRLLLPVGFRVAGANGALVLLIGVDLAQACGELLRDKLRDASVMLIEGEHTLCAYPNNLQDRPLDPALAQQLRSGQRSSLRYVSADGTQMLAAAAATPWGFRVVVAQPLRAAFAASARMRMESLLWLAIGAISAVAAGLLLARAITRPLQRLTRGAERVAQGDFGVKLEVEGGDELSTLSASFNRMCGEIEAREREIRGWNDELRARVEQKTAELKSAQDALLESRKLAAVSALAAGVAHEINNPLTGVIGLTQILLSRSKKRAQTDGDTALLQSVEREALRVRDIVAKMLLLSEAREIVGHSELRPVDFVRDALDNRRMAIDSAGIVLEEQIAPDVPKLIGDHAQLMHVLCELIDNAIKAMRGREGKLTVALDVLDSELVRMRVTDTGRGIDAEHLEQVFEPFYTTKDDWQGQGLGLAVAYRIVEAHHGSIKLQSKPGAGTTVTMLLPALRRGAHLA
jgi:signal transduction histidine kinase